MRAVAFDSRSRVVVAAELGQRLSDVRIIEGESPDSLGALLRFANAGRDLELVAFLDANPTALQSDPARSRLIVAAGTKISALQESDFARAWVFDIGEQILRVDVSSSGHIAALSTTGGVWILDDEGVQLGHFALEAESVVHDVALSPDDLVYVVGARKDASGMCQGDVPFLRTYDLLGQMQARAYDYSAVGDNCASSSGRRVSLGGDGLVYYAGENQGGNTVHRLDPRDLSNPAPLVSFDPFTQGSGKAIERYGFIARFAPGTLDIQLGQLLLPRDSAGVGGEFLIDEILADASGQVILSAQSGCCSEARDQVRVADQALGPFVEPEASVLVLTSDFLARRTWFSTTLVSRETVRPAGLSWASGLVALVAEVPEGTTLLTTDAVSARAGSDGYLLTFSIQN